MLCYDKEYEEKLDVSIDDFKFQISIIDQSLYINEKLLAKFSLDSSISALIDNQKISKKSRHTEKIINISEHEFLFDLDYSIKGEATSLPYDNYNTSKIEDELSIQYINKEIDSKKPFVNIEQGKGYGMFF